MQQPEKCRGCVWGRWDGVKQFCSMPRCVRYDAKANQQANPKAISTCQQSEESSGAETWAAITMTYQIRGDS